MALGCKEGHIRGQSFVGRKVVGLNLGAGKEDLSQWNLYEIVYPCSLWFALLNWIMSEIFQLLIICVICSRHSHQFKKEPEVGTKTLTKKFIWVKKSNLNFYPNFRLIPFGQKKNVLGESKDFWEDKKVNQIRLLFWKFLFSFSNHELL